MRTFGTHTISYPKQCISTVSLQLYHCELVFDEPYNTVVVRSGFGCSGISDGYSDASGIVINVICPRLLRLYMVLLVRRRVLPRFRRIVRIWMESLWVTPRLLITRRMMQWFKRCSLTIRNSGNHRRLENN